MGLDNPLHIAFLLIILLLVFGAKRLPEMGRSLGEGLRGFKDTMSGEVSHHMAATAPHTDATQPAGAATTTVQTQPQALAAAPAQVVTAAPGQVVAQPVAAHAVAPGQVVAQPVVAHAQVTADPRVRAAARMFGAQSGVVEETTERAIEREPELLSS